MKTLIALSDSHGNMAAVEKLFPLFEECDYIVHLGDTSSDGQRIKAKFGQKVSLINGNCDFYKLGLDELTLEIEGVKIFACHGDRYGVKRGCDVLAKKAKDIGCQVALFGHTHRAEEIAAAGVTLFNPGNMSRYSENSYLYLVLSAGKAVGKIVYI